MLPAMKRTILSSLLSVILCAGCGEASPENGADAGNSAADAGNTGTGPGSTATDAGSSSTVPDATTTTASGCPGEMTIAFDTEVSGSTDGAPFTDDITGWFDNSDVSCTTEISAYPAPYAVYSLPMPAGSDWDVTVTPNRGRPGVDVSVVTWLQTAADTSCSPTRGIGVLSCTAENDGGPGEAETQRQDSTTNPYHLMILVTSPPSAAPRGGFSLRVSNHEG